MYTISAIVGGVEYPIHNPKSSRLIVGDPWYEIGDNINGSAEFTVFPEHPFFDRVHKLTSEIVIRNDGNKVFRGRVLYDDEDFSGSKKVVCEGELAYLCDSIQRPKVYHNTSVRDYLADLLTNHNRQVDAAKQFQLGAVTVVDSNDSLYRYSNWNTTRECLSDKLVDKLGGHLVVRWDNGVRYLDYLTDNEYYHTASQKIEFGRNLLDLALNADATDLATCIIPLGAKQEEPETSDSETDSNLDNRLTIESVNNGVDYVSDANAVQEYGKIFKTVTNDDITTPSYLMSWGEQYLRSTQYEKLVLEVKAVDLGLQDSQIERFTPQDRIHCVSVSNGMDTWLTVATMRFYLMRMEENTLTLGNSGVLKTYTSSNRSTTSALEQEIKAIPPKSEIVQDALTKAQTIFNTQLANGYAHYLDNELIISDNPTLSESQRMWRWGLGGLSYSNNGYNGTFRTAWTMDGAFVADFITAGTLRANIIKAGVLSDYAGLNYWNMETGEFSLSANSTVGGQHIATTDSIITNVDMEYRLSDSASSLSGNYNWSTSAPAWVDGKYMWQRTATTVNGVTSYSTATCIAGATGATGAAGSPGAKGDTGVGVSSIIEQYYLSTSNSTQSGGDWSTAQPAWAKNKYIWTRSQITWTDNTVTTTTPVLAKAINGANEAVDSLDSSFDQSKIFNRLTNNGETQGIFLSGGKVYLNGEYINSRSISATQIKSSTITANEINIDNLFAQNITATGQIDCRNIIINEGFQIRDSNGRIGSPLRWYFETHNGIENSYIVLPAQTEIWGRINLGTAADGITLSRYGKTVFNTDADNKLYIGGSSENSDTTATVLRGKSVTIHSHTGEVRLWAASGSGVYVGKSGTTIVTSDENLKDLFEIDSRYEDFFMKIRPVLYRYKTDGHRQHIGYGARAIEAALLSSGLTTEEFAGIVIDNDVTFNIEGAVAQHYDTLYSLRYEEFGALYAHMLQKTIRRLDALEAQISQ